MEKDKNDFFSQASRRRTHSIWEAAKKNELDNLNKEEVLLSKIMLEHQDEY